MTRRLDIGRFRKWLESKPRNSCIGWAQSARHCPLAEFSGREIRLGQAVSVTATGRKYPLPQWASRFGGAVDGDGSRAGVGVSVSECLKILDEISDRRPDVVR